MASPLTVRVDGLSQALKNLQELGGRVKNKGIRRAITAGSKVLTRLANSGAPRDTGLLARSHVQKIKSYRRGAYLLAVIGAKNRKYANGKNPGKYSHLVHDGHKTRGGGRMVPGNPYLKWAALAGLRTAQAVASQIISQEAVFAARALGGQ